MYSHATAIGKAILAWLPDQEVIRLLEKRGQTKFTENTITERQGLIEALRHVRRYGFALDHQEFLPGVMSIGTALRDYSGTVLGSNDKMKEYFNGKKLIHKKTP